MNGPKKWNVLKLKNILRFNPSKSEVGILPEDSPVSFYPMESISEKGKMDHKYSRKLSDVYSGFTYFRNGDILLAKITPCFENGKSAVVKGVPTEFAFGSTEFIVMRPEKLITAEFLFYIINSHAFKTIGEQNMRGTAGQKRIPESFIGDFKIALPSIKEQNQIVEYLNDKLTEIDSLLEHKQKEIEFMDYYKESLVTSCVTGNIDIRHNIEGSENDANRYVRTRN
nr:restriction endonuclease subunit S [Halobacillus halophilus]